MAGAKVTVANQLAPVCMEASQVCLQWFVGELHTDMQDATVDPPTPNTSCGSSDLPVIMADDTDDEDPESSELLQKIESLKKNRDRVQSNGVLIICCM